MATLDTGWKQSSGSVYFRLYVDYSVSTSETAVVVSGTAYLQGKGSYTSNYPYTIDPEILWANLKFSSSDSITVSSRRSWSSARFGTLTNIVTQSFSRTFSRGHSASTRTMSLDMYEVIAGSSQPSVSISIPARQSYAVTYDANGGDVAPTPTTKWYGETLTLSNFVPTRNNYTFTAWNTARDGSGTSYSPGGSYTGNAALALYAQWVYVPWSPKLTNVNAIRCTATTETFTADGNAFRFTLDGVPDRVTAVKKNGTFSTDWTLENEKVIAFDTVPSQGTVITVEYGNDADEGARAYVYFDWLLDTFQTPNNHVISANVQWQNTHIASDSGSVDITEALPGQSGTAAAIIGNNQHPIDVDYTYDVTISVTGQIGTSTVTTFVSGAFFTVDFTAGGKGIGIGCPGPLAADCPSNGRLDVGMDINFSGTVMVDGVNLTSLIRALQN